MNLFKLSGYLSLAFGVICCLFLFSPSLLPLALLCSIIGYVFSTINIYLNAKYEITKRNFSLGYIGMVLSSIPVIFILIFIFNHN